MQYRKTAIALVAALAATLTVATPASAAWRGHWHGGWHRGAGVGLGFATGAIVGSALAAPYYYGGYGYRPYAYDEDYDDGAYAAAPAYSGGGDRDDQYCAQRFKSYDPGSGTYLGYDGARHPCP